MGPGGPALFPEARRRRRHRRHDRPCDARASGRARMAPMRSPSAPRTACFPTIPRAFGPYSPSSRLFLNPLLIDPVRHAWAAQRAVLIDEARARTSALDRLGPRMRRGNIALLRRLVRGLQRQPSTPLDAHVFESARCATARPSLDRPRSAFEARQAATSRYYAFLQWLADGAFAAAQKAAGTPACASA